MCELDADSDGLDLSRTSDCVLHATIFVYKQGANNGKSSSDAGS